jgi:hypothetical protein
MLALSGLWYIGNNNIDADAPMDAHDDANALNYLYILLQVFTITCFSAPYNYPAICDEWTMHILAC